MDNLMVENLCKRVGETEIINNISFSVNAGEILVIKGVTAAGKTTLLKLVAGLIPPTSGIIKLRGERSE